MTDFNYYDGIREDVSAMISEVGTSCAVKIPTNTIDAYGNHVSTAYASSSKTLWVRQLGEVMDIQNVGQLNREDLRFEAAYDSGVVLETKITYKGNDYVVVSIDKPDESGNITHLVGYAKKELT